MIRLYIYGENMKKLLFILLGLSCFAFACSDDENDSRSDIEKMCDNIVEDSKLFDLEISWTFQSKEVAYTNYYVCVKDQEEILDIVTSAEDKKSVCRKELLNYQKCIGKLKVSSFIKGAEIFTRCETELNAWNDCANTNYADSSRE